MSDDQTPVDFDAEKNARVVARVREMAERWCQSTTWDGQPATVVRAFGQELMGALAIHRSDPSPYQYCEECEHFRSEHEGGTGYCRYGQTAVSEGCTCAEFEVR